MLKVWHIAVGNGNVDYVDYFGRVLAFGIVQMIRGLDRMSAGVSVGFVNVEFRPSRRSVFGGGDRSREGAREFLEQIS